MNNMNFFIGLLIILVLNADAFVVKSGVLKSSNYIIQPYYSQKTTAFGSVATSLNSNSNDSERT